MAGEQRTKWDVHICIQNSLLRLVCMSADFLQYASVRMRRDPDIVMAAVKNKGYAMKYAGAELVEDPGFMMKIVTECSRLYKYAGVKAYEFSPLGIAFAIAPFARFGSNRYFWVCLSDSVVCQQNTPRQTCARIEQSF
jgi:hypothetical protein